MNNSSLDILLPRVCLIKATLFNTGSNTLAPSLVKMSSKQLDRLPTKAVAGTGTRHRTTK